MTRTDPTIAAPPPSALSPAKGHRESRQQFLLAEICLCERSLARMEFMPWRVVSVLQDALGLLGWFDRFVTVTAAVAAARVAASVRSPGERFCESA